MDCAINDVVCVCVGHDRQPCKNGRTNRDAVLRGRDRLVARMGPSNHALDGVHIGTTWPIRRIDLCGGVVAAIVATVTVATSQYKATSTDGLLTSPLYSKTY